MEKTMSDFRERRAWGTLIFRKDGKTECPREEATEVRVKGHRYTRDVWWSWPRNAQTIEMIVQVAEAAYFEGREDAQGDMRRALGIEGRDHETGCFR